MADKNDFNIVIPKVDEVKNAAAPNPQPQVGQTRQQQIPPFRPPQRPQSQQPPAPGQPPQPQAVPTQPQPQDPQAAVPPQAQSSQAGQTPTPAQTTSVAQPTQPQQSVQQTPPPQPTQPAPQVNTQSQVQAQPAAQSQTSGIQSAQQPQSSAIQPAVQTQQKAVEKPKREKPKKLGSMITSIIMFFVALAFAGATVYVYLGIYSSTEDAKTGGILALLAFLFLYGFFTFVPAIITSIVGICLGGSGCKSGSKGVKATSIIFTVLNSLLLVGLGAMMLLACMLGVA